MAPSPSLLVICPSYRRPAQAREVLASFEQTKTTDAELVFAVGIKDAKDYEDLPIMVYPAMPMVARSNLAAKGLAPIHKYIGWIADDNRFLTHGWDERITSLLDGTSGGVLYGNDVVSPGSKPSHVFLDSRIVEALGWFLHPELNSTFFDDVWEQIGRGLGTLRYVPDVVVEHRYIEKDNSADFAHDIGVYQHWLRHDLDTDLARIRRALRPRRGSDRGKGMAQSITASGVEGARLLAHE